MHVGRADSSAMARSRAASARTTFDVAQSDEETARGHQHHGQLPRRRQVGLAEVRLDDGNRFADATQVPRDECAVGEGDRGEVEPELQLVTRLLIVHEDTVEQAIGPVEIAPREDGRGLRVADPAGHRSVLGCRELAQQLGEVPFGLRDLTVGERTAPRAEQQPDQPGPVAQRGAQLHRAGVARTGPSRRGPVGRARIPRPSRICRRISCRGALVVVGQ